MNKATAVKVLEEVKAKFGAEHYPESMQPMLFDGSHEELSEGSWVISWEEGEFDWAMSAWPTAVQGAFVEPINSFTLGVFPE